MRSNVLSIFLFAIFSCAQAKEKAYTASTPADEVVRSFLGIPLTDSIDFIRWKLIFIENHYTLHCNYGIGKPNTNGFMNGGKTIDVNGILEKKDANYILHNNNRTLKLIELNADLLHILDDENNLLSGNGGWSYTINSTSPIQADIINVKATTNSLNDSIVFQGRTPCIPGISQSGDQCYKLKWYVILYAKNGQPTTYKFPGVPWYKEGGKTGTWNIATKLNDETVYQLNDTDGKPFLFLLKAADNILLFGDANGKLFVGNEDFSYTLNKR